MADVAREAGVARVTVSRVLSDPDTVAHATREAVHAAIARLGYVHNLTAGSLASSRSRIVGAIVPTLSNAWFGETIDGLSEALSAQGYQLLLGQSRYRPEEEARLVSAFLGRNADAIVLTGVQHAPGVAERLRRSGVPVLECWDLCDDPIDTVVGFSNEAAGAAVARHLLAAGHRQLGFIGSQEPRAQKRLEGFRRIAAEAGAPPVAVQWVTPPSTIPDGAAALQALLAGTPGLQALFCGNDTLALGAITECRSRGIDVPARLAVVGFSDLPVSAACVPALTTVQIGSRAIGLRVGELLLARLAARAHAGPPASRVHDLGFRIVVRASG